MASSSENKVLCNDYVGSIEQLWHICVGIGVEVPRVGDRVFYFPQGHLEMIKACMKEEDNVDIPTYHVPSKVLCKVVSIDLKAFPDSDEPFAEIVLLPDREEAKGLTFSGSVPKKTVVNAFSKILTPTDVSTLGGCSLPKSCVEETFPPLSSTEDQDFQYIMGKDIHGVTWHFQHTYHGNPRRHMLRNGWIKFANEKKLKAGDTCIFMKGRGPNEIFIGIQRANETHKIPIDVSGPSMEHGVLVTTSIAISTQKEFRLIYRPMMCGSQFIVSYAKVMESLKLHYMPQMRFEMLIDGKENHELALKRYSGTIIASEDIDPGRWPYSEWKCFKVEWDATSCNSFLPSKVSPWEIRLLNADVRRKRSFHFKPRTHRNQCTKTSENNRWGGFQNGGLTLSLGHPGSSSRQKDETHSAGDK